MTTTLYGIANCDTVKKAKKWLAANNINYVFHDFRKDGLDKAWLDAVAEQVDWSVLLNKRGTTFRQLPDEDKQDIDKDKALALMLAHPAMIKRPVLLHNDTCQVGFSEAVYQDVFANE
ncbi:ArsC family reductase [Alteromonas sp. CYL-A6]|uniref:ArsC family reductase n=1 Tax=Alteromonas nitratireducens TaxID=3390813 RepID=UPI0034ADFD94